MWGILAWACCVWSSWTVHPHGCGEYVPAAAAPNTTPGSPPRVWGIQQEVRQFMKQQRFTPTGVGNTMIISVTKTGSSVHPHGCGEYDSHPHPIRHHKRFTPTGVGNTPAIRGGQFRRCGSPPRVWGIQPMLIYFFLLGRFTPTGVGNTQGANIGLGIAVGSPPRVWGILTNR